MPSQLPDLCNPCLEEISLLSGKICFEYVVMKGGHVSNLN